MSDPEAPSSCEACGAALAGLAVCRSLFDELFVREFGDYRYARVHRLTVDAYSLQHPEQYMRSAKSFVAHLTGMCAAVEADDATSINQSVQHWLNGPKAIERPLDVPPGQRGDLTIVHVHQARTPDEHLRRVQEWGRSTWAAWSTHHGLAREWIAEATATRHARSGPITGR